MTATRVVYPIENDQQLLRAKHSREQFARSVAILEAGGLPPEYSHELTASLISSHRSIIKDFDTEIEIYETRQQQRIPSIRSRD